MDISQEAAKELGILSREKGIALSLHAPYFISLSSLEQEKRDKSIEYIATSSGYPNTKSFERTFKAVYKTAPNKYRKSLQGN